MQKFMKIIDFSEAFLLPKAIICHQCMFEGASTISVGKPFWNVQSLTRIQKWVQKNFTRVQKITLLKNSRRVRKSIQKLLKDSAKKVKGSKDNLKEFKKPFCNKVNQELLRIWIERIYLLLTLWEAIGVIWFQLVRNWGIHYLGLLIFSWFVRKKNHYEKLFIQ